jgi:2-oxoglutarate ferredoxin oxidoreductase subunit delta
MIEFHTGGARGKRGVSVKRAEDSVKGENPSEGMRPAPQQKKTKRKKREFEIDIYRAWCKACGICVAFCPEQVFGRGEEGYPEVRDPEACIGCGWCEIHCPDFAITVHEKRGQRKQE